MTKDYTLLPLGSRIDDGVIEVCSVCGRHALAIYDRPVNKIYYTHSESIGMEGSELVTKLDWHMAEIPLPIDENSSVEGQR